MERAQKSHAEDQKRVQLPKLPKLISYNRLFNLFFSIYHLHYQYSSLHMYTVREVASVSL